MSRQQGKKAAQPEIFSTPEECFFQKAKKITSRDVAEVLRRESEILEKIRSAKELCFFLADTQKALDYLRRSQAHEGKAETKAVDFITAALLYLLDPMDIIPDAIPDIGYLDDASVLRACYHAIKEQIKSPE